MENELPKNWVIDTQAEKDSPLMSKFMEWFEQNRTETGVGFIYGKTGNRISNWFGVFEQDIITLEQWNAFYFPEWEPKQGEIIFIKDHEGGIWDKSIFIVKYEGLYYCKGGDEQLLYGWKYAKPLPKESILQPLVDQLKVEAKKLGIEKVNITFE